MSFTQAEVNSGTGITVATDTVGDNVYQRVKLVTGTEGSEVAVTPGDASAANQTTGNTSLASIDGKITACNTGAITISAAIPAGNNNIGDVDVASIAAGDNNIGNVDIVSVPAPLSTTGSGTEATALRVTLATDSTGVVSVDDNGASLTVDYATTGSGTAAGALRVELPTNGTGVIATVGAVTAITNALPAGANAIGKLAANSGVDIGDVDITSIAAGDNNIGNVDIVTVPTDPFGVNADAASATGSVSAKLRFIASTGIPVTALPANASVNVAQMNGVTVTMGNGGSGTGVQRVTLASDSTGQVALAAGSAAIGTVTAVGDVAHDGGDSGNPVKVGGKAANALPTAVANNDRTNFLTDLWGRQLTAQIDPAMQVTKGVNYSTTQTGAVIWDPTSGKKIAITSVVIGTYATTAARLLLWFGDNADSTYSAGSDQLLIGASFAPSTTSKPGMVFTPAVPVFCTTVDRELHITTDGNLSVDIVVNGYEW